MLVVKKILCPTDFSRASYNALNAACVLARHFNAKLIIMHVVGSIPVLPSSVPSISMGTQSPPFVFNVQAYKRHLLKQAKRKLGKMVSQTVPKKLTKKTMAAVSYGMAADEILRLAGKEKIDLIVIAAHGAAKFKRFLFGSTVERVIRTASCPVLTVR